MKYSGTITLPGHTRLDTFEQVVEKLREVGRAEPKGRKVYFELERGEDEMTWDFVNRVRDLKDELASIDIELPMDVQNLAVSEEFEDTDAARRPLLEILAAMQSHQPRYNGRPSCPYCGNFVDSEEWHTSSCALAMELAKANMLQKQPRGDA